MAVLGGLCSAEAPPAAPLLIAEDPRRALALIAARFHGRQPRHIAAVTGTSGKTSTAILSASRTALGHKAASIGTLGIEAPGHEPDATLTTPEPFALHKALAELAAAGVEHLSIEASSHGLDQRRLDGLRSRPPPSPISPATTTTTMAAPRPTSQPNGGCSIRCSTPTVSPCSTRTSRSSRPWPRPPGHAACGCSYGRQAGDLRLLRVAPAGERAGDRDRGAGPATCVREPTRGLVPGPQPAGGAGPGRGLRRSCR